MCDVIHAPAWNRCCELVKDEIERCKADLAPLERCEIRAGESLQGGAWHDITPALICSPQAQLRCARGNPRTGPIGGGLIL